MKRKADPYRQNPAPAHPLRDPDRMREYSLTFHRPVVFIRPARLHIPGEFRRNRVIH